MEHSRAAPSPRYNALAAMYRQMHEEGEKLLGLSPEDTFPGRSLPPQAPRIKRLIDHTGARTLLDYGSGKGVQYRMPLVIDGSNHFHSIKEYWGVDAIRCFDPSYAPFSALPEETFDGVICTDVLEHCPEEDIRWIIDEIFSYSTKFVFANVACYPAGKQLPNGENAHCTIKPVAWWSEILAEASSRRPELKWEVWFQFLAPDGAGNKLVEERLADDNMSPQVPLYQPADTAQIVRAMLLEALRSHQTGVFNAAAGLYQRALLLDPMQPDGNRLFGTLCLQTGRFDEAERYLRIAANLAPADAETHNNLGAVLLHIGQYEEAIPSLQKAIALRSNYDDAFSNLGEALRKINDTAGAHAALEKALAINPNHANALFNIGVLMIAERNIPGAINALEQALSIFPGHVAAQRQLINSYITISDYLKAEQHCRTLLVLNPDDHEVRAALASIYIATRQYDKALQESRYTLDRVPDHIRAGICLGQVLRQTGHLDEALTIFQEIAERQPEEPRAAGGIVEVLLRRGELDAALTLAEETVLRHPRGGLSWLDLGTVLEKLGQTEVACSAYRKGIDLLPDQPALHFNLGNQLLLLGRFEEGWQEYEWRTRLAIWGVNAVNCMSWSGQPLKGKTLLIKAEQGMGDMIQFVRLVPMIEKQGGKIMLECQPELVRLFQSVGGIDRLTSKPYSESEQPDVHIPLLSLPKLLGIQLENIPANIPYLAPPAELVDGWKRRLIADSGMRVGIAWSGNPQHIDDGNRSCPPELLAPLLAVQGATFYSVQKEGTSAAAGIKDLSSEWGDFADTASFMQMLDLVITVDTAAAHLAGALGIPVWTLLPFAPDWRWLLDRSDSPWYPSMRLFRQPRPRAWGPVISEVASELAKLANK